MNPNAKTFYPRNKLITNVKNNFLNNHISFYDLLDDDDKSSSDKTYPSHCKFNKNKIKKTPPINNNIKLYYQNVRGLRTKLKMLTCSITVLEYDIYFFSETWLHESITNLELGFHNYTIYRCDRNSNTSNNRIGGGVLIAVRNNIPSKIIQTTNSFVESIFVLIKIKKDEYILNCTYIPPRSDDSQYISFCNSVEEVSNNYQNAKIIITGDFNLPNIQWIKKDMNIVQPLNHLSRKEDTLISTLNFLTNLKQINYIYNDKKSLLDLCFTNISHKYISLNKAIDTLLIKPDKYHPPLSINLHCFQQHKTHQKTTKTDTRSYSFDYKKANYLSIANQLDDINWTTVFHDTNSIDDMLTSFYNKLKEILHKNIPIREHKLSNFPSWVSPELKNLIFDKKIAHKLYKINHTNTYKNTFRFLRKQCRKKSLLDYKQYIEKTENYLKTNPKYFWHHTLNARKDRTTAHSMSYKGKSSEDPKEIVEMFARNFASVYSSEKLASPQFSYSDGRISSLSHVNIDKKDIVNVLSKLKPDSSSGPDDIPPIVLKNCANALSHPLHIIFNYSLSTGTYPNQWKTSYVIPISKGGDKSKIENYRPISKISTIPKIFDNIIYDKTFPIFTPLIITNQHGFTKKKSTTSNLLSFTHTVNSVLDQRLQFDCCATDYSKAFDKININILCAKLEAYGVSEPLLSWFYQCLSSRSQVVRLKNKLSNTYEHSQPFDVTSGCIQGGHMSGLLFNLYINDVHLVIDSVGNSRVKYWLYADDKRLGVTIRTYADHILLQNTLNSMFEWCQANKLELNINKCNVITYHRIKNPSIYNYTINNTTLSRVKESKDLGVTLRSDLKFITHYNNTKNKALRVLGFINRGSKDFKNPYTYKILYLTLVRPILEYASQVWSPHYNVHVKKLESVQRRFLRSLAFKLGIKQEDRYYFDFKLILDKCNLTTLEDRRTIYDLLYFYKIMNNQVDLPELLEDVCFRINSKHTRNKELFSPKHTQTNFLKYSPLYRMIEKYNHLIKQKEDIDIFHLSLDQFKKKLKEIQE